MSSLAPVYDFLIELRQNNHRDWFTANKQQYEAAKAVFTEYASVLLGHLQKKDVQLHALDIKDCLFRINRDVRFSKNKDPYKTHFSAVFCPGGKKSGKAGYYFHLEPGASFVAAGVWMPPPAELKAIRDEIYFNYPELQKILEGAHFYKHLKGLDADLMLKQVPKGYDADHPGAAYLKLKSYTATRYFTDKVLCSKQGQEQVKQTMEAAVAWVKFLNRALELNEN